MRLVILESPFAGDVERNIAYARKCVRHALSLGDAPIASHLLYTQPGVLCDDIKHERQWGIDAGLAWKKVAELSAVYTDLGITKGMRYGIDAAEEAGMRVEYRSLGESIVCEDSDPMLAVRNAINKYHLALDRHEHGGVAMSLALDEIRDAMKMNWECGKVLEEVGCNHGTGVILEKK